MKVRIILKENGLVYTFSDSLKNQAVKYYKKLKKNIKN